MTLRLPAGPYTTSDKITGSKAFSAPLGANYGGNPSATFCPLILTMVYGQDVVGRRSRTGNNCSADFTFATDSSGDIVSWDFAVWISSPE